MEKEVIIEKIKKKMVLFFQKMYGVFADFKVSMIILLIWTVVGICSTLSYPKYDLEMDTACLVLLFFFSLLFETCLKGKKKLLLLLYPLSVVLSVGLIYLSYQEDLGFYWIKRGQGLAAGCLIVLIIFIVYCSYKKLELSFPEYVRSVFYHLFQMSVIYIIVWLGIEFIWLVVDELFSINLWYADERTLILQNFYVIPYTIYGLNHMKKESSPTFNIIAKYLINIFSGCGLVIGYAYVLKIIFSGEMPSNAIFTTLTVLFAVSAPTWILNESYKDGTLRSKIISILPYVFAPLILMQIYSIGVRIWSYALTMERYAAVMVVIFEIGTILIWKVSRNHCERLLLLLAALVIISVTAPVVNMYSLSLRSQKYLLDKYLEKQKIGEELSELEYKRYKGAYRYQETWLSSEEFEKYGYGQEFLEAEAAYEKEWHNIHGCQMSGEMDVAGFTKMNMLNQSEEYDSREEGAIDFSRFKFYKRESGEEVTINLNEFYEKCMEFIEQNPKSDKEDTSAYMKQYNRIVLEDGRVFYVNHFEIRYATITKDNETAVIETYDVNISGMLLER